MNLREKRQELLEALQAERGLYPAEVTELLDMRIGQIQKRVDRDVKVGRLVFRGVYVDERIAAQKRDELALELEELERRRAERR